MWGSRRSTEKNRVECLACGSSVARSDAREYDKYGDRWERTGKTFEHLCKECHTALSHQPRTELEDLLCAIDAGTISRSEFFARYETIVQKRYGPFEEREQ